MSQHSQYANSLLPSFKPVDASSIIRGRLSNAEALNEEVSDWLKERAKIEETYALSLEKLSQKKLSEIPFSGLFEEVWVGILKQTKDASKASAILGHKIVQEVENPLRRYCSKSGQWSDAKARSEELDSLAHSFSSNDDKVDKLRKKSKQHQLDTAESSLNELRAQWENQAPFILEQIETIDEARLGFLKNSLIAFETLETDKSQYLLKKAEVTLNNILSFEPMDEIATFAVQPSNILQRRTSHTLGSFSGPSGRHGIDRNSITELTHIRSNRTERESLYETPSSPVSHTSHKREETASKLRSKVGSIFRSSKKNKGKGSLSLPSTAEEGPSRSSHLGFHSKHKKPTSIASRTSSFVDAHSQQQQQQQQQQQPEEPQSIQAQSQNAVPSNTGAAGNRLSRPPPPPARKANGVSLSTSSPVKEDEDPVGSGVSLSIGVPHNANVEQSVAPQTLQNESSTRQDQPTEQEWTGNQPNQPLKFSIQESQIAEAPTDDDDVALSVIASQLRARNTVSRRTQRGRRDIQSTLFANVTPSDIEQSGAESPVKTNEQEHSFNGPPILPALKETEPITLFNEQNSAPSRSTQSPFEGSNSAPVSEPIPVVETKPVTTEPSQTLTENVYNDAVTSVPTNAPISSVPVAALPSPPPGPFPSATETVPATVVPGSSISSIAPPQSEVNENAVEPQPVPVQQQTAESDLDSHPSSAVAATSDVTPVAAPVPAPIPVAATTNAPVEPNTVVDSQPRTSSLTSDLKPAEAASIASPPNGISTAPSVETLPSFAPRVGVVPPGVAPELPFTPTLKPLLPNTSGLKCSLVEHISANIKDGEVERAQLAGEIALASDEGISSIKTKIKIGNFGIFKKVLPNYRFITALGEDANGENLYEVDMSKVNDDKGLKEGVVAFKVLTDEANAFVPVDFSPIWRIEKNISRLMLIYKVANSHLLDSPITLRDVEIVVPVEGGNAISAQSKPKVVFNQAKQCVSWKFDELVVKPGVEGRLLCQFETTGPTFEARQGISVKFSVVGENGHVNSKYSNALHHDDDGDEEEDEEDQSHLHKISIMYEDGEESKWVPLPTLLSLRTGKFVVHGESNVQTLY